MDERPGRPKPLARSVVASRHDVDAFGKLLVSEAYQRRFSGADRKAFVADGSESNWGVWGRHFSDYVPILDFIHALTYVYAAALAGQALKEGWRAYRQWAQGIWSGQVDRVIAALELRQQELGDLPRTLQDRSCRHCRHLAGLLAESAIADELPRVPQARIADYEHLRGIDGQANQPTDEGNGEILVAGQRINANARCGPSQRHPDAQPLLAESPPPPHRLPGLPIPCRLKSQSGWCALPLNRLLSGRRGDICRHSGGCNGGKFDRAVVA